MSTIIKHTDSDFKLVASGTHLARCIRVIDIGTQHNDTFNVDQHKVIVIFELPNELIKDKNDQMMPMFQSKEYTMSLAEKSNLRKDLLSLRGKDFSPAELEAFDLKSILGVPCMLSISHVEKNNKTYANISSIVNVPKGTVVPDAVHEIFAYDIEDGILGNYGKIQEWIQQKIQRAKEITLVQESPEVESQETPVDDGFGNLTETELPF